MGWGGYWNNWAYFDAFQPYWGWNAWNRPYWNSWGWNRWNRWNRFNWGGFYTPFYGPRWGMGYWDAWQFGGNPYFYNYGYGFNNRWGNQRLWNNRINRRAQRPVRSASYRGEVPRDNNRRVVAERNVQARENGTLEVPLWSVKAGEIMKYVEANLREASIKPVDLRKFKKCKTDR